MSYEEQAIAKESARETPFSIALRRVQSLAEELHQTIDRFETRLKHVTYDTADKELGRNDTAMHEASPSVAQLHIAADTQQTAIVRLRRLMENLEV